MFALLEKNTGLFGLGASQEEALQEINEWTDGDYTYSEDYNSTPDGELVLLRCSPDFYEAVTGLQGDISDIDYTIENNIITLQQRGHNDFK
jgi:hypothetical protein